MTLQQIYYLTEIAAAGSINRAAEKLFLSQPALTNAVKEAEEELGFRIFNRNSRGISLTPDGTEFLARELRLKMRKPSSSSASLTAFVSAGCERKSFSAARLMLPAAAISVR